MCRVTWTSRALRMRTWVENLGLWFCFFATCDACRASGAFWATSFLPCIHRVIKRRVWAHGPFLLGICVSGFFLSLAQAFNIAVARVHVHKRYSYSLISEQYRRPRDCQLSFEIEMQKVRNTSVQCTSYASFCPCNTTNTPHIPPPPSYTNLPESHHQASFATNPPRNLLTKNFLPSSSSNNPIPNAMGKNQCSTGTVVVPSTS